MNKYSNPIDTIIDFALLAGADKFWVYNARDELKSLQKENKNKQIVAWAQTNDRGDLYDLRLQNNLYIDQSKVIPLYRLL
jgi:hypothetical protein